MEKINYTVGYDIGIASIGWAIVDDSNKLIDTGVRRFKEAIPASEARLNRSARVTLRRKKWRLEQLRIAFSEFNLEKMEILDNPEYKMMRNIEKKSINKYGKIDSKTVYHLRKKGLKEKLSTRELFICMHNISKTRGHFYMDTIDFTKGTIDYVTFRDKFLENISSKLELSNHEKFCEDHLVPIFTNDKSYIGNRSYSKFEKYCLLEEDNKSLFELLKFLKSNKVDNSIISEEYEKSSKMNINDYKKEENNSDFIVNMINIFDMIEITKFLKEHEYLCEKLVDQADKFDLWMSDEIIYKEELLAFKNISKDDKNPTSIKNIGNNYPNGMYLHEAKAILNCQQQFNSAITKDFIDVVCETLSAHIPYWMGKLSDRPETKNSWMSRSPGKVKYSYNWSQENLKLFDEEISQENWKKAMISRCTYFPDDYALPKQSFISELFIILNELNVLSCNNGEYYLTTTDKQKVISNLFLKKKDTILFEDVKNYLGLDSFGMKSTEKSKRTAMNKVFSLYHNIISILEELEIKDILKELSDFQNNRLDSKIYKIEDIIMSLNLFDDEKNKFEKFKEFGESKALKLSKLNTKDFSSFGNKILIETGLNGRSQSMLDILFNDNNSDFTNEQMTIITNAVDINGNRINLSSNKYKKMFEAENKLNSGLLLDDGKPFVPMSRPVLRSISELFKVHNDIEKYFGKPMKIVIETARDIGDPKLGETAKHYNTMTALVNDLNAQLDSKAASNIESLEEISAYINANKIKIELYLRQMGIDIISGDKIVLSNLKHYQVDHILPRGFGDNSMDNSILILGTINNDKDNRTPLEFIRAKAGTYSETDYINRVKLMYDKKWISSNKYDRLMLEDTTQAIGFVQRNLVDTRYIIKEFTSILEAYYSYNCPENMPDIVSLQGTFNGVFRNALQFPKSRDIGDQHHAHDAAIIVIVDKCLNALYPNYNKRSSKYDNSMYQSFMNNLRNEDKCKSTMQKTNDTIRLMYLKAYGNEFDDNDSLIEQIKNIVPLLSWKQERNYKGQFFHQTIYPQQKYKESDVLSILGINNTKAIYSNVNSYCVDFYKMTVNKGGKNEKKKHFAVHVPKVIIDRDGVINEDLYLKLIKEHYNYTELIDFGGNLIKGAFRLRMRANDLYFDTERNQMMLFNIGSVVNKILECKDPNIYSYNQTKRLANELYEFLELNYKEKRHGLNVNDHLVKAIDFLIEHLPANHKLKYLGEEKFQVLSLINNNALTKEDKKQYKNILTKAEELTKLIEDKKNNVYIIIYYIGNLILKGQNIFSPPPIIGQILPTVNNVKLQDTYYQKVVASPLGVRWSNEATSLKVTGIKGVDKRKNFKLVKKDEFTWQV